MFSFPKSTNCPTTAAMTLRSIEECPGEVEMDRMRNQAECQPVRSIEECRKVEMVDEKPSRCQPGRSIEERGEVVLSHEECPGDLGFVETSRVQPTI